METLQVPGSHTQHWHSGVTPCPSLPTLPSSWFREARPEVPAREKPGAEEGAWLGRYPDPQVLTLSNLLRAKPQPIEGKAKMEPCKEILHFSMSRGRRKGSKHQLRNSSDELQVNTARIAVD